MSDFQSRFASRITVVGKTGALGSYAAPAPASSSSAATSTAARRVNGSPVPKAASSYGALANTKQRNDDAKRRSKQQLPPPPQQTQPSRTQLQQQQMNNNNMRSSGPTLTVPHSSSSSSSFHSSSNSPALRYDNDDGDDELLSDDASPVSNTPREDEEMDRHMRLHSDSARARSAKLVMEREFNKALEQRPGVERRLGEEEDEEQNDAGQTSEQQFNVHQPNDDADDIGDDGDDIDANGGPASHRLEDDDADDDVGIDDGDDDPYRTALVLTLQEQQAREDEEDAKFLARAAATLHSQEAAASASMHRPSSSAHSSSSSSPSPALPQSASSSRRTHGATSTGASIMARSGSISNDEWVNRDGVGTGSSISRQNSARNVASINIANAKPSGQTHKPSVRDLYSSAPEPTSQRSLRSVSSTSSASLLSSSSFEPPSTSATSVSAYKSHGGGVAPAASLPTKYNPHSINRQPSVVAGGGFISQHPNASDFFAHGAGNDTAADPMGEINQQHQQQMMYQQQMIARQQQQQQNQQYQQLSLNPYASQPNPYQQHPSQYGAPSIPIYSQYNAQAAAAQAQAAAYPSQFMPQSADAQSSYVNANGSPYGMQQQYGMYNNNNQRGHQHPTYSGFDSSSMQSDRNSTYGSNSQSNLTSASPSSTFAASGGSTSSSQSPSPTSVSPPLVAPLAARAARARAPMRSAAAIALGPSGGDRSKAGGLQPQTLPAKALLKGEGLGAGAAAVKTMVDRERDAAGAPKRAPEYTVHTLAEYRELHLDFSRMGGLGPDLANPERKAKEAANVKVRRLAHQIRETNAAVIEANIQAEQRRLDAGGAAKCEPAAKESAIDRAKNFAKGVPKPRAKRVDSDADAASPPLVPQRIGGSSSTTFVAATRPSIVPRGLDPVANHNTIAGTNNFGHRGAGAAVQASANTKAAGGGYASGYADHAASNGGSGGDAKSDNLADQLQRQSEQRLAIEKMKQSMM